MKKCSLSNIDIFDSSSDDIGESSIGLKRSFYEAFGEDDIDGSLEVLSNSASVENVDIFNESIFNDILIVENANDDSLKFSSDEYQLGDLEQLSIFSQQFSQGDDNNTFELDPSIVNSVLKLDSDLPNDIFEDNSTLEKEFDLPIFASEDNLIPITVPIVDSITPLKKRSRSAKLKKTVKKSTSKIKEKLEKPKKIIKNTPHVSNNSFQQIKFLCDSIKLVKKRNFDPYKKNETRKLLFYYYKTIYDVIKHWNFSNDNDLNFKADVFGEFVISFKYKKIFEYLPDQNYNMLCFCFTYNEETSQLCFSERTKRLYFHENYLSVINIDNQLTVLDMPYIFNVPLQSHIRHPGFKIPKIKIDNNIHKDKVVSSINVVDPFVVKNTINRLRREYSILYKHSFFDLSKYGFILLQHKYGVLYDQNSFDYNGIQVHEIFFLDLCDNQFLPDVLKELYPECCYDVDLKILSKLFVLSFNQEGDAKIIALDGNKYEGSCLEIVKKAYPNVVFTETQPKNGNHFLSIVDASEYCLGEEVNIMIYFKRNGALSNFLNKIIGGQIALLDNIVFDSIRKSISYSLYFSKKSLLYDSKNKEVISFKNSLHYLVKSIKILNLMMSMLKDKGKVLVVDWGSNFDQFNQIFLYQILLNILSGVKGVFRIVSDFELLSTPNYGNLTFIELKDIDARNVEKAIQSNSVYICAFDFSTIDKDQYIKSVLPIQES
ncbi:hypothetical protein AB837_00263 [bacterium AB1]|nr:hypothetical protein AB837_00263 [bacterium AB1]